ncbi:MAG: transglycosylase domain-containing protein [Bryobacteraceae bacterium]
MFIAFSVFAFSTGLIVFSYYYMKYARMIDEKLASGPFASTSKLYAAPQSLSVGDEVSPEEIVAQLRRAGFSEARSNRVGWYHLRPGSVEIFPGVDAVVQPEAGVIRITGGRIFQIISLRDNTERTQYLLEPELITNLFDHKREKRRLVRFDDIPKLVVNAVISAEDKRFFLHAGFDPFRILKSAYVDLSQQRNAMGASTLSMQVARSIWLDPSQRNWQRKIPEILITLHLERKLTKEQIFEYYANTIYLGRVGSFNIHGLAQGAQVYFGKDLGQLTMPEAAMLAGVIQSPSRYNPFRWPDRARSRRNVILSLIRDNGFLTPQEYVAAVTSPLTVVGGTSESEDAPYFVDLVNGRLLEHFQDHDFQSNSYRVYTSLDLNLQRAAAEAMREGLKEVDELLRRRGRTAARGWPQVQAALVALDPRTGEVKALLGGRDYGASQLNRALARRQPGSSFKPFVYAAALNTALEGGAAPLTPISRVIDEPTTFWFDNKPYEPNNFMNKFHGPVSLRLALSKSLNIPTVKFAEIAGYDRVVELARNAGLNMNIQPTPAVALGAYEVTPLEIAGGYTIFANQGVFLKPSWITTVVDQKGKVLRTYKTEGKPVLDPRVSYLMVNLMEEVLRSGTGVATRGRGFVLPAAGKTGTSHDGWFAGFTSELICVVWVGYDDNRELKLEGAHSALPIWTAFMKRAHKFRPYRSARPFEAPAGVVAAEVDIASGKLAVAGCGSAPKTEFFVAGTQPVEMCSGGATQVAGWEVASPAPAESAPQQVALNHPQKRETSIRVEPVRPAPRAEAPNQKRGFWGRIRDIFR